MHQYFVNKNVFGACQNLPLVLPTAGYHTCEAGSGP